MADQLVKIQEALNVLKIAELPDLKDFDKSIKKIYYELAFELHPDKNGDKEAFQNLSGAYQFLIDLFNLNKPLLNKFKQQNIATSSKLDGRIPKNNSFKLYKEISNEYSKTLEDYFNRVRLVNLNPDDPDYINLCNRFKEVKKNFFSLIQEHPSEPWVGDCIEKIHRINIWLKSQNYSSS